MLPTANFDPSARMHALLDHVPAMLGYWDKDLHNQYGNQAYSSWLGIDPQRMRGMHIRDVLGEARFQLNLPYIEGALRGERQVFERAFPESTGKRIRHSLAEYIPDVVAGEVQGFFVQVSDISPVKHEQEVIRASEEKLRGLFNLSPMGIGLCNMNGRFVEVNPALCQITGYTETELNRLDYWMLTPESYAAQEAQQLATLIDTGRFGPYEKEYLHKDGHLVAVRLNGVMVTGEDGKQRIWAIVEDIREHRSMLSELTRVKEFAQAANEAKSRFLTTMSHEIRTPMNAILGMAQVLLLPGIDDRHRMDYAATIVRSGETLLALLNDILDLSRVEAGKLQLESIAVQPLALITATEALFSELARSKGLTIACRWAGAPEACYLGDPHRLQQMLSNLVSNAIKFTQQGHVHIEAREVGRSQHHVTLEFGVSDTGVGIAPDKLPLLFQSFSQADTSTTREYGGSGLGLSIVRNLAELMGGGVDVHSAPGQGSRFWFYVQLAMAPMGAPTLAQALEHDVGNPVQAQRPVQFGGHVLVAEDTAINQRVIQALLGLHGLQATVVADGQQALDALAVDQPVRAFDLVLMDLQMPVMDGCTATQRLRAWEAQAGRARVPVVALTAGAFEEDRQRCLDAGMDEVLTKPLAMDQLQTTLARWLSVCPVAMAAPDPGPAQPKQPLDVARIRTLLADIMPLLASNKFTSIACFRQLQDTLAGTELAAGMARTARLLQEFRFNEVQQHLRQLAAEQGWEQP